MGTNIFAFVVVLGVLIFFHELGHFLMARLFGVGVEKFSLGFGPKIFGKTIGITDYRLSAIPLGGYVKMVGEEPDAELTPEEIPLSFTHKPVSQRILIVAAGPGFNLLLALLIFFGIFLTSGMYIIKPTIGNVDESGPAYSAGIRKGDKVFVINQTPVQNWEEMAKLISDSNGQPIHISLKRGEETLEFKIIPKQIRTKNLFGEDIDRYIIGVMSAGDTYAKKLGIGEAFVESFRQTYKISELTVLSVVKIFQGTISTKTLGGPIMIAQMAGEQAKEGAGNLIFFIALLSINLAILNFLPIPVLDGGHLFFFFIEAVIRKPVNMKVREVAQGVGVFLLILLMVFVFYNDISRIFFS